MYTLMAFLYIIYIYEDIKNKQKIHGVEVYTQGGNVGNGDGVTTVRNYDKHRYY